MKVFIGIDPGLQGACAFVSEDGEMALVFDTPTARVGGNRSQRRDYLLSEMVRQLRGAGFEESDQPHAVLELTHSMPGQGVASSFTFGRGLGIWQGILAALEIPYDMVSPVRWKKAMLADRGKAKDAARIRAAELFPVCADLLTRKCDCGRADALLLAEYGRRWLNGRSQ